MTFSLRTHTTKAEYDVIGEPPMRSYLGPYDTMVPYGAQLEFHNGEFVEIAVWGHKVSRKTGRTLRKVASVTFRPEDLGPQEATEDFEPHEAPEWVKKLVGAANFGGKI